jgi:hypothetical protein
MSNIGRLASIFLVGVASTVGFAGDLSQYRNFKLRADLPAIAKQTGVTATEAKVIHSRPALIQTLNWRPKSLGLTSDTEPAQEVIFSFYNGELFRIGVSYDRYATEGLTEADVIEGIAATYGDPVKLPTPVISVKPDYGDPEKVLARWEDPQYRLDLIGSSYGPSFRLIAVLKTLDASAEAASIEAARLDDKEAPQRDAARIVNDAQVTKAKLEKARLLNKPNFRP